jgi:hypothetical protein
MHASALIGGLLLVVVTGSSALAAAYPPFETVPQSVSTLDCVSAVDTPEPDVPTTADAVVFGRVAIARDLARSTLAPYTGRGTFKRWVKAGLLVRRHGSPLGADPGTLQPIVITVPRAWRSRAALAWGNTGLSSAIRITPCRSTTPWLVFTGGYYVNSPTCFPLNISTNGKTRQILVSAARSC